MSPSVSNINILNYIVFFFSEFVENLRIGFILMSMEIEIKYLYTPFCIYLNMDACSYNLKQTWRVKLLKRIN